MHSLKKLTNDDLITKTKFVAKHEKKWNRELICHLAEIFERKIHLEYGCDSLKDFCIRTLGYEAEEAAVRESAARLLVEMPEAKEAVEEGDLSMTRASKLGSHLRRERAIRGSKGQRVSAKEKRDLLETAKTGTSQELKIAFATHTIEEDPRKKEKERILKDGKTRVVQFVVDEETAQKLEELKDFLSHQNPGMSVSKVLEIAIDQLHKKKNPQREVKRSATGQPSNRDSRSISLSLRSLVFKRAKGRCEFENPKTKKRCSSKYRLQVDHIKPFSRGGKTEETNLRVLCQRHNLLEADRHGLKRPRATAIRQEIDSHPSFGT